MKQKCYLVVHTNYADGMDAYAFWSEDEARKSVRADFDTEMINLREKGYDPVDTWDTFGNPGIYVKDTDIYYEWNVIETTIE